jgi:hypothetical protein
MNTVNTGQMPSCEWPDAKRPPTFRNCYDRDGCFDNNLGVDAAEDRIQKITKQLACPHGLTNKERRALANERQRFERWLEGMRPTPVAEMDDKRKERRLKATEKKLSWQARKFDRSQ